MQAVNRLLTWGYGFIHVNHRNSEGKTAWDILQGQTQVDNSEIRVMLRDAKAKPASSLSTFNSHPNNQSPAYCSRWFVHWRMDITREMRNLTEERRNILLMVAVLVATLSFQVILTPPGGLWQDYGECINLTEGLGSSHHNGSNHLTPFNLTTVGNSNYPVIMHLTRSNTTVTQSNTTLACEHKAGTAVALEDRFFLLCAFCSCLTFSFSNALMVALAPGKMKLLFLGLHFTLSFSYWYSVRVIMDDIPVAILLGMLSAEILLSALVIPYKCSPKLISS